MVVSIFLIIRTSEPSGRWTFGQMNLRTDESSDRWTFGQMNLRTDEHSPLNATSIAVFIYQCQSKLRRRVAPWTWGRVYGFLDHYTIAERNIWRFYSELYNIFEFLFNFYFSQSPDSTNDELTSYVKGTQIPYYRPFCRWFWNFKLRYINTHGIYI